MKKEQFLEWLEVYEHSLAHWKVEVGKEVLSEYTVGCFKDTASGNWKVYINKDRGRHSIRLETKDEEQAFNKLKSLVAYVMESNRGYN